ncbi:hypothetical protein LX32DRAFT_637781 [Colletotrichum zoysiae]|uniref:Uncharacterized protein n=1 Tax=Colletotrichum zoysiae TaxID=1216348 RepID=A0AAD9HKP9_9PEZI|nr:hypothetical protein LX32DRAFT_637781 [Colletotrichum zoysiae]
MIGIDVPHATPRIDAPASMTMSVDQSAHFLARAQHGVLLASPLRRNGRPGSVYIEAPFVCYPVRRFGGEGEGGVTVGMSPVEWRGAGKRLRS